jgi:hypothetical protein
MRGAVVITSTYRKDYRGFESLAVCKVLGMNLCIGMLLFGAYVHTYLACMFIVCFRRK